MSAIEIIALVVIVISVIKLIVLAINPQFWYGRKNPLIRLWTGPVTATVTSLVLGAVVLYYLLEELTITQIFAASVFGWIVIMLVLAPFSRALCDWLQNIAKETKFWHKVWISALVWIALMAWVLWEMFV